jgi:hypothetical protein
MATGEMWFSTNGDWTKPGLCPFKLDPKRHKVFLLNEYCLPEYPSRTEYVVLKHPC